MTHDTGRRSSNLRRPARQSSTTPVREQHMTEHAPTTTVRIIQWPTHDGRIFDTADTSLTEAGAEELRFFAEHYAGIPLLELMQRLRLAEWNATEYQRQAEQAQESARRMPPLSSIREMDARHRRVRALLEAPGQRAIPRAALRAALTEPTVTVHATTTRREAS